MGYTFALTDARGSIEAPATADGAAGTAAYYWDTLDRTPYSSVDLADDGQAGLLLAAPSHTDVGIYEDGVFTGTSAAAPHAAGVATLLYEVAPDPSPARIYVTMLSFACL